MRTRQPTALEPLVDIQRESSDYKGGKRGRIPPADSPTRPQLARLWMAAHTLATNRQKLKTFTHHGHRYGVIYIDSQLCVMDWQTRRVLVKPPTSMTELGSIVGAGKVGRR